MEDILYRKTAPRTLDRLKDITSNKAKTNRQAGQLKNGQQTNDDGSATGREIPPVRKIYFYILAAALLHLALISLVSRYFEPSSAPKKTQSIVELVEPAFNASQSSHVSKYDRSKKGRLRPQKIQKHSGRKNTKAATEIPPEILRPSSEKNTLDHTGPESEFNARPVPSFSQNSKLNSVAVSPMHRFAPNTIGSAIAELGPNHVSDSAKWTSTSTTISPEADLEARSFVDAIAKKIDQSMVYPDEFLLKGWSGIVKVRLLVSPNGERLGPIREIISPNHYLSVYSALIVNTALKNPLPHS
jgi:hypothetical protein